LSQGGATRRLLARRQLLVHTERRPGRTWSLRCQQVSWLRVPARALRYFNVRTLFRNGFYFTTKLFLLAVVPPGFVTAIAPLVAPAGTVAEMKFRLSTLNAALTPLKVTAVEPIK